MAEMELHWLGMLGLALGLAMDALAVSIAAGLAVDTVTPRHVFRVSFHFGLFQFMMPVVGWLAGEQMANRLSGYDHWLAFALLAFVGGKMLWEAGCGNKRQAGRDPTRGLTLVVLSLATSLDALAVGFSMALVGRCRLAAQRGHRNRHRRFVRHRNHVWQPHRLALGALGGGHRRHGLDSHRRQSAAGSSHGVAIGNPLETMCNSVQWGANVPT